MSEKKKIENPGLVWAIEQLRIQRTKPAEQQMFDEIRKAVFLVPARVTPVGEPTEANEKGERKVRAEVRLRMITSKSDNAKVVPLFTDDEQKDKAEVGDDKPTYVPMRLADVARVVANDPQLAGVVINPYGSASVRLNRAQVGALVGAVPQKVEVRVGTPSKMPADLVERLTAVLRGEEGVSRAWLRFLEKQEEKGFLCVVEGANVDYKKLFPALAEAAKPYPAGLRFYAAPYQGEFGAKATKDALPFYERDAQVM